MLRSNTFAAFLAQTETGGDTGQLGGEPIDELFVFERISGCETVRVTDSPVVRVLEPRAHHRHVFGVRHGVFFLRRFDLRGIKQFVVLTQRAEIESFAFGLMRIEMIARRALDDAPRRVIVYRQHFGTQTVGYPFDVLLVLLFVEGAGRIKQYPAGFEGIPYVHQDGALTLRALTHGLQTPFAAGLFVLAEHTFARTRGIDQNTVEDMLAALAVFGGGVMRDDGVAVAPFLDVFAEHKHALTHHLVAQ